MSFHHAEKYKDYFLILSGQLSDASPRQTNYTCIERNNVLARIEFSLMISHIFYSIVCACKKHDEHLAKKARIVKFAVIKALWWSDRALMKIR